jgi:hypothetical protein
MLPEKLVSTRKFFTAGFKVVFGLVFHCSATIGRFTAQALPSKSASKAPKQKRL